MASVTWTDQSGYLANAELTKEYQKAAQPLLRFRQFVSIKGALGKNAGESVNFDKVSNIGTYGGSLVETNTMVESSISIAKGTLTITEYGNSIPLTSKLRTLSYIDVMKIIKEGLLDDSVKVVDGVIERQFNSCLLRYVGSSTTTYALTTNGTATVTNTSVLNSYHIRKMLLELKKRNVPGWSKAGGDYAGILSLEAMEGLEGSAETVNSYTESGYQKIINGEFARMWGCRLVEDSFATRFTYSASARTATAKSWGQSQSLDAYFFGSPTVMEGIAIREEIRAKEVTDYGRSQGLAWYGLFGWKLIWDSDDGQSHARIIKWDSAG